MRSWMSTGFMLLTIVSQATAAPKEARPGTDFFGIGKVHQIHLSIGAEEYQAMNPPPRQPGFGFGRPGARPGQRDPNAGVGKLGFTFKYIKANATIADQSLTGVGLRYKGNGTYLMSTRMAKRPFKIDFNRFQPDLHYQGLKKINLHNGVMDQSKIHDVLAYDVYRLAGVPSSRTALVEVALTVPGKYDKEHLGLYSAVEQADKSFLKHHFKSSKGLLLKPEGIKGFPYRGDDPEAYKESYNPKTEGTEEQWKRLIAFTQLVSKADDETFQKEIASYLDIDNFVRFLAATVTLVCMDSFIGLGHNYYMYLSPETNKFYMFPWDLDLSFGTFYPYGSAERQAELRIYQPHSGEPKVIDRLLAMPKVKAAYEAQLKYLATEIFTTEKLGKQIDELEKLVKDLIEKDQKAAAARRENGFGGRGFGRGFGGQPMPLKTWISKRAESVLAQLSGKSKGIALGFGFGGSRPGGGFGRPRWPTPGSQISKPLLEAVDTNKDGKASEAELTEGMRKLFRQWDKDKNGIVDEKEMSDGLQQLIPRRR